MLRKPITLQEFKKCNNNRLGILHENGTLIHVLPSGVDDCPIVRGRLVHFEFDPEQGPMLYISGANDDAIADTVAYFMDVPEAPGANNYLQVGTWNHDTHFDFRSAGSLVLSRLLESFTSRSLWFTGTLLSAEQSLVLASASMPIQLNLTSCTFEDGGTQFVAALENRQSCFGSLSMNMRNPVNAYNMQRLFQVDSLDHLDVSYLNEKLVPLSAKANSITFFGVTNEIANSESLNIVAPKLTLGFELKRGRFPSESVILLFRRLAALEHLVELKICFHHSSKSDVYIPTAVSRELIRTAFANNNLQVLDLTTVHRALKWKRRNFAEIFDGLKEHPALHTLKISVDDPTKVFGPSSAYLIQLLSHKRDLVVTDEYGLVYTDGAAVDELYALNRFYWGSADLVGDPSPLRPSLVSTALIEGASNDLRRTALILADHVDTLDGLVRFADLFMEGL
jgi:hypothetical protein